MRNKCILCHSIRLTVLEGHGQENNLLGCNKCGMIFNAVEPQTGNVPRKYPEKKVLENGSNK